MNYDRNSHEGRMLAVEADTAWRASCAKVGKPEAAGLRAGGTREEIHDTRKMARQMINALTAEIGVRDVTREEGLAMNHGGVLISSCTSMLDGFDGGASNKKTSDIAAMRTAADFRNHYEKRVAKSSADDGDISVGDFLRGVANLKTTTSVKNALSVGTDSSGGYAVPSIVMPEILAALAPVSSLMLAGMGIVALQEGGKSFTTAVVDTIPTAAWRSEGGTIAESEPAFRGVVATPRSLSFYFKVSRELLADSPNMENALRTVIATAFAKEMDRAGLRGTGTAPEPRGLLSTSGIAAVGNGPNGTSLTGYASFFSGIQSILQANAPMPTAAIMSPRSLVKLGGLVDTLGQPIEVPPMLQPMKLIATSQVPNGLTVGTSTDCSEIYLGDFTNMSMMLRESLSVQLVDQLFATTGQIGFVCHARVDFAVMYPASFAVVTGVRA